jgi:hypothetical protein
MLYGMVIFDFGDPNDLINAGIWFLTPSIITAYFIWHIIRMIFRKYKN